MNLFVKTLIAGSTLVFAMGNSFAKDVATVNGKSISQKDYEQFLQYRAGNSAGKVSSANRKRLIDEMVNRELIYQDAEKKGITKDPAILYSLEQLRIQAILEAMFKSELKKNPITELEMKNEYKTLMKTANKSEYKASHILLKTEDEAKAVIKELEKGAVFADVAKAKSTGPSGKNGGDLGWFSASQMVPPFSQAVMKMKKGAISKTPVKTQFGYHVIKLEDTRKLEPPKYEAVKKQIHQLLQNRRLQQYVARLREKAKVEVK